MSDLPHTADLRWGRFSEPGAAYHVTKCRVEGLALCLADPAPAQIIISLERTWETGEYVHENPVRRGLCATAQDWAWSTANSEFRGWIEEHYLE